VKILYVVADNQHEWNSAEHRCAVPARAIKTLTTGNDAGLITIPQFAISTEDMSNEQKLVAEADLIFIQRNIWFPGVYQAMRYWMDVGKAVVLDVDDNYFDVTPANPAFGFWTQDGGRLIDLLKAYGVQTSAVTSPSKLILKRWNEIGMNRTVWVPNWLDGSWYLNCVKKPHEGFWVGWYGGMSHYDTWFRTPCREAIKLAWQARPDIKFALAGTDRRIIDMIDIPPENKVDLGGVKFPDQRFFTNLICQFDVSVGPVGGAYDHYRSWLKAAEPMLAKVPFICPKAEPFYELLRWGQGVEDTVDGWLKAILWAHDNYTEATRIANEAYVQALDLTIERRVGDYIQTLKEIWMRGQCARGQMRTDGAVVV
jgi:hypothetical protein